MVQQKKIGGNRMGYNGWVVTLVQIQKLELLDEKLNVHPVFGKVILM